MRSQTNRRAYMDSAPALKKTFDATAKSVGDAWQEIINEDKVVNAAYQELHDGLPDVVDASLEGMSDAGVHKNALAAQTKHAEDLVEAYGTLVGESQGLSGKWGSKAVARKKEIRSELQDLTKKLKVMVGENSKLKTYLENMKENGRHVSLGNMHTEKGRKAYDANAALEAGDQKEIEFDNSPSAQGSESMMTDGQSGPGAIPTVPEVKVITYNEKGEMVIGGKYSLKDLGGLEPKAYDTAKLIGDKLMEFNQMTFKTGVENPSEWKNASADFAAGLMSMDDATVMSLATDRLIQGIDPKALVSPSTVNSGNMKDIREELVASLLLVAEDHYAAGIPERQNYLDNAADEAAKLQGKNYSSYNKGNKDKDGGGKSLTPAEKRAQTKITQTKTAQTAFTNFRDISKEDMASKETREKLLRSLRSNMNSNLKIKFQGLDKKVGIKRMEISELEDLPGTIVLTVYGEGSEGDKLQKMIPVDLNKWDAEIPAFREFIQNELLLQQWEAEEIIK